MFFFFKIALALQGLLWFHTSFRIVCCSSVKNAIGVLIGNVLNLCIALGSMEILTIFDLLIHEHEMFFHLFMLSKSGFF